MASLIYNALGPKGDKGPTGDRGPKGATGNPGGPGTFVPVRRGIMKGLHPDDRAISPSSWTTFRWVDRSAPEGVNLHWDERGFVIQQSGFYFVTAQIATNSEAVVELGVTLNNKVIWGMEKGHGARITNSRIFVSGTMSLASGEVLRCAATMGSSSTNLIAGNSFFTITSLGLA